MKIVAVLSLSICVLLVPLVDAQWEIYQTRAPERRITPMYRALSRVQQRHNFQDAQSPQRTTTRSPPPTTTNPIKNIIVTPENDAKISQVVVDFMIRLSRTVAQSQSKAELFSPLSISSVANLLYLGSSGVTREEFGKLLTPAGMGWGWTHQRFGSVLSNLLSSDPIDSRQDQWRRQTCPSDEDDDDASSVPAPKSQVIRVANGIFYNKDLPIRPNYVTLSRIYYNALVQPIDPSKSAASTAMINKWVSEVTAGKIPNMIEGPLSQSSSVVVVNALYFKSKWKTQFEPLMTRDLPFFPDGPNGPSFRTKMMSLSGCLPFYKTKDPMEVTIVGLPYKDDTATMYLIQPANSSRAAVRRLQGSLNGRMLDSWIGNMKLHSTSVRLPKMHIRNSIDLLKSFQKVGFNSILSPAKSDLSKLIINTSDNQRPYVNQILHKIDISIDEEGTEGAAATSALVDRIGSSKNFNGNAPFIIYLRHDATGLPLFYGPVFDPR